MKSSYFSIITALTLTGASALQAQTVFSDSFNYTVDAAFVAEGGWTRAINTGSGLGCNVGAGFMYGNPGTGVSALEFEHPATLNVGEVITMSANVDRGTGYSYGRRIILWDGADAGTRQEVAGGTVNGVGPAGGANYNLPKVEYAVTPTDIANGLNHVVFRYSNDGAWGQTNDVTFAVNPAPVGWTWTNTAGGSWATISDWTPDGPADGADAAALINSLDITSDQTITLDGSYTIGTVRFADIAGDDGNWILEAGTGVELVLSAPNAGSPGIVVSNQTATIGAILAGTEGMTKTGAGTLVLGAANTYTGGTFVNVGTVQIANVAAIPAGPGNGNVTLTGSLDLNDNSILVNGLTGAGPVTNSGTGTPTLTIGGDDASGLSYAGVIGNGTGITSLRKTGSGTLTLTAAHTFSGTVTGDGGTLILGGGFNRLHNVAGISVNSGATVELNGGNMFVADHETALENTRVLAADAGVLLMNTSMDSRIGNVSLSNGATWTINRGVAAWDVLLANTTAGAATVTVANSGGNTNASQLNGAGGIHLQGVQNFDIDDVTGDAAEDFTITIPLAGRGSAGGAVGGVNKLGTGTMQLSGINYYAGDTIVTGGVLILAESAELRFVIGADGVNNKVTGPGTATHNGNFNLDLSGADTTSGNSWTLADAATQAFGANFTVLGFTKAAGVHTFDDGSKKWTFKESSGVLTVANATNDYDTWATSNGYWTPGDLNTADSEDFDRDGITNGAEWAFGLNPTKGSSVSPITPVDKLNGNFTYTRRNPTLTNLTFRYEWSTTLAVGSWIGVVPAFADAVVPNGNNQTVTVDLIAAPGDPLSNSTLFVRVVATP